MHDLYGVEGRVYKATGAPKYVEVRVRRSFNGTESGTRNCWKRMLVHYPMLMPRQSLETSYRNGLPDASRVSSFADVIDSRPALLRHARKTCGRTFLVRAVHLTHQLKIRERSLRCALRLFS